MYSETKVEVVVCKRIEADGKFSHYELRECLINFKNCFKIKTLLKMLGGERYEQLRSFSKIEPSAFSSFC